MPNQIIRHQRRRRGAVVALAQGAGLAWRNRNAIVEGTQAVKKYFTKPKSQTTRTRPAGGTAYAGGNDFTSSSKVASTRRGKQPKANSNKMLGTMVKAMMPVYSYRFQNITNYDTNVGGLSLGNLQQATGTLIQMPLAIYDLTSLNNRGLVAPGRAFRWLDTTATAGIDRQIIPTQGLSGGAVAAGTWTNEQATSIAFPNTQHAFHKYTDIKLNLYGARKRTTWFEIMIVRVNDDLANPFAANPANLEYKQFIDYLQRPCIYSNLVQNSIGKTNRKFSIIKKYKYFISAAQTTDVDTSVGKIKEVKIFLKHNVMRDFDWRLEQTPASMSHAQEAGNAYIVDTQNENDVRPRQRVFMVIRAFAPERRFTDAFSTASADANVDPTYDIIIRNVWGIPQNIN